VQNKKKKPFHAGSSSQAKDKAQAPKERIVPFSRMLSELKEAIKFIGDEPHDGRWLLVFYHHVYLGIPLGRWMIVGRCRDQEHDGASNTSV
jgi:hypothetical protein